MKHGFASSLVLVSVAGLASGCAPDPDPLPVVSSAAALSADAESFYVVLEGIPAAQAIEAGVDPRSAAAAVVTRARVAELQDAHADFRPMLEAHGAMVIADFARLANAIQILATPDDAARIARLPGVVDVERVPLVMPALASALPVVGAPEAWAKGTLYQGDGITIGIVDTGIDYTHADFAGIGTADAYLANDSKVIEPGSFPTAKVIGGWDFVGDDYNPSANINIPKPDPDPLDCTQPENDQIAGGHGSHVAGIAAGTGEAKDGTTFAGAYEATYDPSIYKIAPGIAPKAKLWALKVFGCDGSTTMLGAALERAADPNEDGSFDDRLDVVNASLGTAYALSAPTTHKMVTNLSNVGTLLVAAAGNDGQTFFAHSSPGSYPEVLSVAASADNEFLTLSVTSPPSAVADYAAAEGGFTTQFSVAGPVSGELVASAPALGCTPFTNAAAVAGKIALIDRGTCSFIEKFDNAVAAGAVAVVMVDDQDDPLPFAMGGGDPGTVPIPGVMVRLADGMLIETALGQGPVTVSIDPAKKYVGIGTELLAGFSSRGPSSTDSSLKPDIAAPGLSIDSARVGSGSEARRSQGTSMASPMVAGAAALVRQAQPDLGPFEVKAALINATEPLKDLTDAIYGTSVVGSGRVAVERAVDQRVTAASDPDGGTVGVAFGPVVADAPTTVKRTFVVTNHAAVDASLEASVEPTFALPGVGVTVSPTSFVVPAGQKVTVDLTLTLDPTALGSPGPDPGTPEFTGQGMNKSARHYLNEANGIVRLVQTAATAEDVLLPYNGNVRAAVNRKAKVPSACALAGASPTDPVAVELEGTGAHPAPVVTAFQLGAVDAELAASKTDPTKAMIDLRAAGAATDLATAASFDEARIFFGVAVTGTWTTPARGPISVVAIEIRNEHKGPAIYSVRAEPRNADGPYRDSLVASTYRVSTGERISRRPLDIVGPDVAKTHPFNNSVLVLSALLSEIGVDPANPVLDYAATSENPETLTKGERTDWATFDAGKPALDTARHGLDGQPLLIGDGPYLVDVSPDARAAGTPLDLLVLHHTNVEGARYEVVSLATGAMDNLALSATAPATVGASGTETVTLVVTNGTADAPKVQLDGTVTGGELVTATPTQGTCTAGAKVDCALGDLAPGATATVTATVRATPGSTSVAVDASVQSDLECESATDDNTAKAALGVSAAPITRSDDGVRAEGGGCGCRVEDRSSNAAAAAWLAAALGAMLLARRRRAST